MAEEPNESRLETCIGIVVVLLATFMALCSVKAGNIGQKMQQAQVDRNNNWAWYQARNIRQSVYESTAAELSIPAANETDEARQQREAKAAEYRERATSQEQKMEKQKSDAEAADAEYNTLGAKDDQFDISEAALALGLAMMGVTALLKRWWLFYLALVPSLFGLGMGLAGFAGMSTETAVVKWMIDLLS
jgi:hypothetical protein